MLSMNFTRVTPGNSVQKNQPVTITEYDFPLRTTLTIKSHCNSDLTVETEQEMAETHQYDHLRFDGLCKNTIENLTNGEAEEKKTKERRVLSCSAVLISIVCVISLISLVLTLLMLTGNVSTRCSCIHTKDSAKQSGTGNLGARRGKENGERDWGWLLEQLHNITEKMDGQSRVLNKLENNILKIKDASKKTEERLTESIEAMMDLDSKTHNLNKTTTAMQSAMASSNRSWAVQLPLISKIHLVEYFFKELNKTTQNFGRRMDQLRQDLSEIDLNLRTKINTTTISIKNSKGEFLNYVNNLNKTLTMKIENLTITNGPGCPIEKRWCNESRVHGASTVHNYTGDAANFSLCQYKVKASIGILKNTVSSDEAIVWEPKDKRIVGSSCSTDNAAEYNLIRRNNTAGDNVYICRCKGKSVLFQTAGLMMHCYIHYWECPF